MTTPTSHSASTILPLFSFLRHSPFTYLGLLLLSLCAFAVFSLSVVNVVNHHPAADTLHTRAAPSSSTPHSAPSFEGVPPSSSFERVASFPHDSSCQYSAPPLSPTAAPSPSSDTPFYLPFPPVLHVCAGFTQGLEWYGELLYETCGMYGASNVRVVNHTTGRLLRRTDMAKQLFAEGLTIHRDAVYALTWREGAILVYDLQLSLLRTAPFAGEGWGLTHSETHLIASNGSAHLTFLDPATLQPTHTLTVTTRASASSPRTPVLQLNELEYIGDGTLLANVWMSSDVLVISAVDGRVQRRLRAEALWKEAGGDQWNKVVNGLAYKADEQRLFMTGKLWPTLFEVRMRTQRA